MVNIFGNFLWAGRENDTQIYVFAVNLDNKKVFYLRENTNKKDFIVEWDYADANCIKLWNGFPKNLSELDEENRTKKMLKKLLLGYVAAHILGVNKRKEIAVLRKILSKI